MRPLSNGDYCFVDPLALAHSYVAGFDERNDDALAKTARDVKAAGGTLVAQLGIQAGSNFGNPHIRPWVYLIVPDAYSWTVPHVMSAAELKRLGDAYTNVALRLARLGFDGIELHGAHGYLLTCCYRLGQILEPTSTAALSKTDPPHSRYRRGHSARCGPPVHRRTEDASGRRRKRRY